MPKLNDIKGIAEKPKKKSAKQVPALELKGRLISKYNAAADRAKQAQAEMNEVAPTLIAEGLNFVFTHNCACREDTKKQIKSVNLTEVQPDGTAEVVQFTWSTRSLEADEAAVKAHFQGLRKVDGTFANVNAYAEWQIVADFDKKVFVDAKGKFDQARFDEFQAAIQKVADKLGVDNPLTFFKEFKPTKEMNDLRFKELSPEQNLALHLVLPTGTSLEPVRSNGDEE